MKKTISIFGKYGLWLILSLLKVMSLSAQPVLLRGTEFPVNPVQNTFLHNPQTKELHHFINGAWKKYDKQIVDTVFLCNNFIWLEGEGKGDLLVNEGLGVLYPFKGHYCGEAITGIWNNQDVIVFFDAQGHLLAIFRCKGCNWSGKYMLVQGQEAFCVPAKFEKSASYNWDEMRNWGILASNGKWLIAPKFDAPFRFENGIAEVTYYGQKRKINEKGEFVDER